MLKLLQSLPAYLRLLVGMIRDSRVGRVDRLLVVASIVYLFSPFDVIPDVVPVVGQIDDLFLVVMAVARMFDRAPRGVAHSHWDGSTREFDPATLRSLIYFASLFATPRRRRKLRGLAGAALGA